MDAVKHHRKFNHCCETDDAYIISDMPEADYSIGGDSVIVIMKSDGWPKTPTEYHVGNAEKGKEFIVIREFDF